MNNFIFPLFDKAPICMGTGLVALDIVFNGKSFRSPKFYAGGSCGNVLTILSYLGWKSYPIVRIGTDEAGNRILKDWERFGVYQEYVYRDAKITSPIIVEQISHGTNGFPTHKFLWVCPNCGAWLPRYRPLLLKKAKESSKIISLANCFYFDRVSPGALALAEQAKKAGIIVFFEPPSLKNNELFRKAIKFSHILKVAKGRKVEEDIIDTVEGPEVIIQTLGSEGVKYKILKTNNKMDWELLPPFPVVDFKDAAGAGDWCSAGIIFSLASKRKLENKRMTKKRVVQAIEIGQAMAALNCSYEGARGGMYNMGRYDFEILIKQILKSRIVDNSNKEELSSDISNVMSCLCPSCCEKKSTTKQKYNNKSNQCSLRSVGACDEDHQNKGSAISKKF